MEKGKKRARAGLTSSTLVSIGIGVLSAVLGFALYRSDIPPLREIDLRLGDNRFVLRGPLEPNPNVVIAAIDEKSVNELGRWPWPRSTLARIIKTVEAEGPRAVVLDVVFSEPESRERDAMLGESIREGRNVVLGYFFREESAADGGRAHGGGAYGEEREGASELSRSSIKATIGALKHPVLGFRYVEPNLPIIANGAAGFGFFNFPTADSDGILRRAQLVMSYEGKNYPSLGVEGLSVFRGKEIAIKSYPEYGIEGLVIGGLFIPTDESGRLPVNYYGPSGSFKTYSVVDILKGKVPSEALRDKLVFIGATETGIYDARATPFDPFFPGVEIHATIAANALDGATLLENSLTRAIDYLLIAAPPILLVLLLASVSATLTGGAIWVMALLVLASLNYLLFSLFHTVTSLLYPAISLSLAFITFEGWRNIAAERRARYLRKAFSSYVSPELVSKIIEDPARLSLGGESRAVSILFADIRDFTSIAETLRPAELVRLLNEYLGPMTKIVMSKQGTLDKYIGDALMGIFGAPIELPGHAKWACRAAVEMVTELRALNSAWEREGLPGIGVGIGINTGEAVVGNMGTDVRFDYTAIGDEVNLAARLEALNKLYGTEIIISRATLEQIDGEEFIVRELDVVTVKGKANPTTIYELMGYAEGGGPQKGEIASRFASALTLYRSRKFREARDAFRTILNSHPEDKPSALYVERASRYLESPPNESWDGVYDATNR